jgi:hypothetical protein
MDPYRVPQAALRAAADLRCRSACGEDGAFEDDSKARVGFEPRDRREQESANDADREDIHNG